MYENNPAWYLSLAINNFREFCGFRERQKFGEKKVSLLYNL